MPRWLKAGGYARLLALSRPMGTAGLPAAGGATSALGIGRAERRGGAAGAKLEAEWIDGGFMLEREELLSRAEARIGRHE